MLFSKTFKKVHQVVDEGSEKIQNLVKKAETFVGKSEELVKSSDNSLKIIAGFVITAMGMQILVSYTQFRVNVKMLSLLRGVKNGAIK